MSLISLQFDFSDQTLQTLTLIFHEYIRKKYSCGIMLDSSQYFYNDINGQGCVMETVKVTPLIWDMDFYFLFH